jgi:hypothetical protein
MTKGSGVGVFLLYHGNEAGEEQWGIKTNLTNYI